MDMFCEMLQIEEFHYDDQSVLCTQIDAVAMTKKTILPAKERRLDRCYKAPKAIELNKRLIVA